jgi:hypothetical protein
MNRQVHRWNTQRLRKVQLSGDHSLNDEIAIDGGGMNVISRNNTFVSNTSINTNTTMTAAATATATTTTTTTTQHDHQNTDIYNDDDHDDDDDDDDLPGAYAITRINLQHEAAYYWDPTEQEMPQVHPMSSPPNNNNNNNHNGILSSQTNSTIQNPQPSSHLTLDHNDKEDYNNDNHPPNSKFQMKLDDIDSTTLEAQVEYLGTKPPPKKSYTRCILISLVILILVFVTVVILSTISSLTRTRRRDHTPQQSPHDTDSLVDSSCDNDNNHDGKFIDPRIQCHCWDRIQPTDEIQDMYHVLLSYIHGLDENHIHTLLPGDITSCTPENIALVWTAMDRIVLAAAETEAKEQDEADASSSSSISESTVNRFALALFYMYSNGQSWQTQTNWLRPQSECTWFGIQCEEWYHGSDSNSSRSSSRSGGSIVSLSLPNNNLQGTIGNLILKFLPHLREFNLSKNRVNGTLPSSIWNHTSLGTYMDDGENHSNCCVGHHLNIQLTYVYTYKLHVFMQNMLVWTIIF